MRIAQISAVFPPYKGGIGQVVWHHSQELARLNQSVTVFTPDYGDKIKADFTIKYLKTWLKWGKGAFCPQLFSKLRDFDVIVLHYPAFGLAEVVWLWKKLAHSNAKLVILYHHDVVGSGLLSWLFKLHKFFLLSAILNSADKILVSSFDYAEHSDVRKLLPGKFVELPFGVSAKFKPGKKDLKLLHELKIAPKKKVILFVGGMDRNHYFKGVDILLKAVSKLELNDWHLLLVGGGELIYQFKQLTKKLNIMTRVTFAGSQPAEKLVDFYQLADIFVLPSIDKSEAFGLVLLEAMACGSPVIASALPGVRTVVKDEINGYLVPPSDVDMLKLKIEDLLTSDDKRHQLSVSAVQRIRQKFLWSGIGQQLLELYNKLYL